MEISKLLELSHNHINGYIKAADQKASILLGGQLALAGFMVNYFLKYWNNFMGISKSLAYLSAASILIAGIFSALVIFPREGGNDSKGYIYWGNVLNHESSKEFIEQISGLDDEEIIESIGEEVYAVSSIADEKYKWFTRSLIVTGIFIILGLLFIVVRFV